MILGLDIEFSEIKKKKKPEKVNKEKMIDGLKVELSYTFSFTKSKLYVLSLHIFFYLMKS